MDQHNMDKMEQNGGDDDDGGVDGCGDSVNTLPEKMPFGTREGLDSEMIEQKATTSQGASGSSLQHQKIDESLINENPRCGEGESTLEKLLRNELVAGKIAAYLTLADMKAVSEVSRGFYRMIRSTQQFDGSAMLLICKETVNLQHFLVDTAYSWKIAQVDLSLPVEVLDIIQHILETVHTLQLRFTSSDHVEEKDLNRFIAGILMHTPNLEHLEIESRVFEKVLHDIFSDVLVQASFCRLKTLKICSWNTSNNSTYYIDGVEVEGDQGPFQRNFYQLSLIPEMKLECFKMAKICTLFGSETEHVSFIPHVVAANADTLKELSLHLNIWKLDDMKSILCPRLKSLSVTAFEQDAAIVIAFLINQPLLEELDIDMRDGFPLDALSVIQGKCSKLKKLHIKAKHFINVSETVDWSFLRGMEKLEDFSIFKPLSTHQVSEKYGLGAEFLSVLPAETVKKIELRGLMFWQQTVMADEVEELEMPQKMELLNRFQNLTDLRLTRCDRVIDDDLMQNIIRELKGLKVLEFSHCDLLTDFGLTGLTAEGEQSGVSLKELKCLTHLKIRACRDITTNGILQAVAFPYLRSLDYLTVIAVSKEFLLQIAEQNPSLECLSVFLSELEDIQQIKGEIKSVNPRLWKFTNLNESNWIGEDSDSDADSLRFGFGDEDGDSDISGGGYPHGFDHEFDVTDDDSESNDYDSDGELYY